jgi:hypothetical protein
MFLNLTHEELWLIKAHELGGGAFSLRRIDYVQSLQSGRRTF